VRFRPCPELSRRRNADGNRVEKSNGSTGTIYWYMSPGIIPESDLSGNLKSEYVFFDGERVARKDFPSNTVSYYFSDELKTASVITNSAGTITEDEDFYPWGGEIQFVNSDSNHYKFGSHERDSESGLDYFGARYYGNWTGRFLTPDWAGHPTEVPYADFGNPQSLNLYSYTKNNPTTFGDPDGHCCLDAVVNFTVGLLNAWGSDNLAGAGRMQQTTAAGKVGQFVGDLGATVQGAVETGVSAGGEALGVGLDGTVVLAPAGLTVNAVSTAGLIHGSLTTAVAGRNLFKDVAGGNSSQTPQNNLGGGQIGEPNGPKPGSAGGPGAGRKATPSERKAALSENNGNCVFCGKKADQVDHSIPRSRGGNNTKENLQPACASCNQSKNDKTSQEFLDSKNKKVYPH
jgi:RHS repeat-associated protein